MKKHCIWAALAIVFAGVLSVSCTSSQSLTSKRIVKEFNKLHADESELSTDLRIGTYECNSAYQRLTLAKLEAAGLIDYTVTRYAWWEESQELRKKAYYVEETRGWYYTWTETVTKYKWVKETVHNFEDHYVVNVALTNAGKRLIADTPSMENDIDEDLYYEDVDPSTYKWNKMDLSEDWADIPNPFLKPEKEDTTQAEVSESVPYYSYGSDEDGEAEDEEEIKRIEEEQFEAYSNLSFNSEDISLKAGARKAIKARNILVTERDGIQTAEAEVIIETCNATDAGRILLGFENGRRSLEEVELIRYIDKGWVIKE